MYSVRFLINPVNINKQKVQLPYYLKGKIRIILRRVTYHPFSIVLFFCYAALWLSCQDESSTYDGTLPDKIDYNHHIKPILSDRCFTCHGPDANAREANLRLDIASDARGVLRGGWFSQSEAQKRIYSDDDDYMMPPPSSNLQMSDRDKALLAKWIEDGAEYQDHWSFTPILKPEVPNPEGSAINEIDRFILAALEDASLSLNPQSDPSLLLRRLSLDLTGLPPSLEDIERFTADPTEEAYEQEVDRLISSPHFGERMATDWMDVARFADTHGYQSDRYRDASPWRDWVIKAFNENKPYDEFVTWQLAGDLLDKPTKEQIMATAFLRLHPQNEEGGIVPEEFRVEYVVDRVNTVGTAFMGMTLGCAKCHDHKYDPISQKEYFELFSFFNNVKEAGQISFDGAMPIPTLLLTDEKADSIITF